MNIPKRHLKIEYKRGTGPGGQHRNKTDSACKVTHLPTGITAEADERSQHHSRRKAIEVLTKRILEAKKAEIAATRKMRRDDKVTNHELPVRTYNFVRGTVKDRRSGKVAPLKEVLEKGRIDLMR